MDNELFELCKKVYEATRWTITFSTINGYPDPVPLYDSDYLLEKLPKRLSLYHSDPDDRWKAVTHLSPSHMGIADTPLKALLHLTLALHNAGELPIAPSEPGELK